MGVGGAAPGVGLRLGTTRSVAKNALRYTLQERMEQELLHASALRSGVTPHLLLQKVREGKNLLCEARATIEFVESADLRTTSKKALEALDTLEEMVLNYGEFLVWESTTHVGFTAGSVPRLAWFFERFEVQLLEVDEAGQMTKATMLSVFAHVVRDFTKVLMLGDPKQCPPYTCLRGVDALQAAFRSPLTKAYGRLGPGTQMAGGALLLAKWHPMTLRPPPPRSCGGRDERPVQVPPAAGRAAQHRELRRQGAQCARDCGSPRVPRGRSGVHARPPPAGAGRAAGPRAPAGAVHELPQPAGGAGGGAGGDDVARRPGRPGVAERRGDHAVR